MNSSHQTPPKAAIAANEIGDDMIAASEDLASCPRLREVIEFATATLLTPYHEADTNALKHKKCHWYVATSAAFLGMIAVVLAILELKDPTLFQPNVEKVEVMMAILSAVAVLLGLALRFQSRWLLERHKAERYRLLKFGFITDSELWCATAAEQEKRREQLKKHALSVHKMTTKTMHHWLKTELTAESPALKTNCAADDGEILAALVNYYQKTRLDKQARFFKYRMKGRKHHWRISSWLFFGSIFAAFVHFAADSIKHSLKWSDHGIIAGSLLLAAVLPVIGATFRTYRSTYEYARNAMRYEAKLIALRRLDKGLVDELKTKPLDSRRIFHDLWCCEQIFEFEHREWLRLMLEAEWYG